MKALRPDERLLVKSGRKKSPSGDVALLQVFRTWEGFTWSVEILTDLGSVRFGGGPHESKRGAWARARVLVKNYK